MFVRKKKNRSGTTSVVVVDKHGGKFKELHTVGIANSDEEIEKLLIQGKAWINSYLGVQKLDFDGPKRKEEELYAAKAMLGNVESILLNGAKFILDKVYDNVLRHLVVARLCHPMSRMATVDYLNSGHR